MLSTDVSLSNSSPGLSPSLADLKMHDDSSQLQLVRSLGTFSAVLRQDGVISAPPSECSKPYRDLYLLLRFFGGCQSSTDCPAKMAAAKDAKTELLCLEQASTEQKFMLMLMERLEACEAGIAQNQLSHSFNVDTHVANGVYFNVTLWEDACPPGHAAACEQVIFAAQALTFK